MSTNQPTRKRKICALLLAAMLLALLPACGTAPAEPGQKYSVEENTADNKATYPYIVRTESATWYLSADDMALLGKETYLEGLYELLQYQEADFADARAELSGFIWDEIPPIDIYTDFCGKAEMSEVGGGYYNERRNFIKMFSGWDKTEYALVHEYVHYLTFHCTDTPVRHGFFAEGIAEYVSKMAGHSRLVRCYYGNVSEEDKSLYKRNGAWDEEEDCLDPRLYFFGIAELFAKGAFVGREFFSTADVTMIRTEEIQQNPTPLTVSHYEAASITAYLMETYTKEFVLSHLDMDPADMETVFGEPFSEIYRHWAAWNAERCAALGLITD